MLKILILFLITNIYLNAKMNTNYFENVKDGWFYFKEKNEDIKEEQVIDKDKELIENIDYNNLSKLTTDEFSKLFDDVKKIAVQKPTKENVTAHARLKKYMLDQSDKFAKVSQIVLLENPNLEFPEIATTNAGIEEQYKKNEEKREKFFKEHQDDLSFVVFYNPNNEELIAKQQKIYNIIERKYKINVEYVDLELRPFLIEKFDLKGDLENYFVYKNENDEAIWKRVKNGMATKSEILENSIFLYENAILEKDK